MKSDELKEAMKESPRRYTNPFLSDEENEKLNFWNNQEHECSNIEDDLKSNCEDDKLRNSSEFCKQETELYTDKNVMECELPELLVCYKEGASNVKDICVDEGIPHGEKILFNENNHEVLYISSPVNEDKHDGIIDDSCHAQFLKPKQSRFSPMEDYDMESNLCSGTNSKVDTDLPVLEPTNDQMHNGDNREEAIERNTDMSNISTDTETPVQDIQNVIPEKDCEDDGPAKERGLKEEVTDSVVPNQLKNMSKDDSVDDDGPSECDTVSKATDNNGPDISVQTCEEQINSSDVLLDNASTEQVVSNSVPSLQQDQPLPSLKSLLESIDQQPCQSPVEEPSKSPIVQTSNNSNESTMDDNNTLNLNNVGVHKVENPECVPELSIETSKNQDLASDNVAILGPVVQRGEGESSFSVAGPVSGLITYSGPIAFSGSTSIRSDSSTTSTRSFAFPILQNEWNSSPVRMAKADRRRLHKHRGWRHGLLCCRF